MKEKIITAFLSLLIIFCGIQSSQAQYITPQINIPSQVTTPQYTFPGGTYQIFSYPVSPQIIVPQVTLPQATLGGASPVEKCRPGGPNQPSIVDVAETSQNYDTFIRLVRIAGLNNVIDGPGIYTIFAPTDEAFAKLPPGTLETLSRPENLDRLRTLLNYHIARGYISSSKISNSQAPIRTIQGESLLINVINNQPVINNYARILETETCARNGAIYPIDSVLQP